MLRQALLLLLALTAATLVGCGNKGPLTVPVTRPAISAPAAPPVAPAPAATTPTPPSAQH